MSSCSCCFKRSLSGPSSGFVWFVQVDTGREMIIVTYWVQHETSVRVEADLPFISMNNSFVNVDR